LYMKSHNTRVLFQSDRHERTRTDAANLKKNSETQKGLVGGGRKRTVNTKPKPEATREEGIRGNGKIRF